VHGFQKAQRQAMPPAPVRLYVCGGHKIVVIWCCSLERSDTHIPRERSRMPQLYSRHLGVTIERGVVTISYRPSLELTLGSAQRSRDILNRVTAKLKGAHPLTHRSDDEEIITQFDIHETRKLETVIAKIDLMLDRCANEPLMPRMVEEILGITSAERRRWTKDGACQNPGWRRFVEDHNRSTCLRTLRKRSGNSPISRNGEKRMRHHYPNISARARNEPSERPQRRSILAGRSLK
jgi:hypothetical protein